MPPRPPDPRAHPMAVGHGPQQDGSWPMEDRISGASLGSLPGVKPSADRGCRETDATLLNRDSPFLVAATTMWEIETNGVGNGVAGSPGATGWTGSVDTPPWGSLGRRHRHAASRDCVVAGPPLTSSRFQRGAMVASRSQLGFPATTRIPPRSSLTSTQTSPLLNPHGEQRK